jgi:DNA gyrase subunit A
MEGSQPNEDQAPAAGTHKVVDRPIEKEMEKCYIDYAMSVIISRALPDVRDGLKPVHRRILYSMYDMGLTSGKKYMKSARVVGECFVPGTRILTGRGLVRIEDVERGEVVYTQNGQSTVSELFEMPERELYDIILESGVKVTVTPSQPLKVIDPGLNYEWRLAKDIHAEDNLVLRLDFPDDLPYIPLPSWQGREMRLDEDIAYLVGQFLSDGWFEKNNMRFCFFSRSGEIMERVQGCLQRAFGHEARIEGWTEDIVREDGTTGEEISHQVRVRSRELNSYLAGIFGIDSSWKSPTKRVPEPFFQSPKQVLAALLSGLIDGGGSVHVERNLIHYGTTSPALADDLQVIMQHLGVMTRRYIMRKEGGLSDHRIDGRFVARNHDYINIEAVGRFAKVLAIQLTLADPVKSERLSHIIGADLKRSGFDCIPFSGKVIFEELSEHHMGAGCYEDVDGHKFRDGICYPSGAKIRYSSDLKEKQLGREKIVDWGIHSKLNRIGSRLAPMIDEMLENEVHFVKVKQVRRAPPQKTFDLQVEGAHEFIANGIVSHNCMGKYHPHGDLAVYDSLVRMAQTFSLRYTLIDGQGNFGSVDGDSAAAMRYTECKLEKIAEEMLQDIDKETVEWTDNFDASLKEPTVLPGKLPNLLVNGTSGIAVGMATNIPPHNLREVVDAIIALIDRPELEALDLMNYIKGPDFPTGGIIYGINGIVEAYSTGKGRLKVRAKTKIEEKAGKKAIIVNEIPYQVNKSTMIESIAELVKEKRVEGITDLRDESDRDGIRIVMELRRDAMEEIVLNQLFQHSQMEVTFGVINLAIVNNEPKVLTLKETLQHYITYRKEIVVRRTRFELAEARKREHILLGLIKAVDALDETLHIIRSAQSGEEARAGLMVRFELDEEQAKAILDMRLQKLTGLEIEGLRQEFADLEDLIKRLEEVLASEEKIMGIIKAEVLELREKYGDDRKTEIVRDAIDLEDEDLIPVEDMVIMITQDGYIKRLPLDTYKQQRRGGIGLMGMETKEEDHVTDLFVSSTHDNIMFFTNRGKMFMMKTFRLPVGSRQSKGKPIVNLLPHLEEGEKVIDNIPVKDLNSGQMLVFATKKGRIKKTALEAYKNVRSNGIIALGMNEGDELIDTKITNGTKEIVLATKKGRAIRFNETDVRPMGRPARGVRGIRLYEGDEVVSMAVVTGNAKLLTITEFGYGKVSIVGKKVEAEDLGPEPSEEAEDALEEEELVPEPEPEEEEAPEEPAGKEERDQYRKTHRGGRGIKAIRVTERNGKVVAVLSVQDEDGIIIASDSGDVMRTSVSEFRVVGRVTMGVKAKRLAEGERVIAVARLVGEHDKALVATLESKEDESMLPQAEPKSEGASREEDEGRE